MGQGLVQPGERMASEHPTGFPLWKGGDERA